MYRRLVNAIVDRGKTQSFLEAMRESSKFQLDRDIRARTTVWGSMTGQTNNVLIASDFNTLMDLEKYTDLSVEDSQFATIRRAVSSNLIYEATEVSILRLSYHSEGLISSEEATEPRAYMRILTGEVQAGRHRAFVHSISLALEYQKNRGIDATTSVWGAMTGGTSEVSVVAEFDSLSELEKFDEMAMNDAEFARHRRETRESMVFLTSHVDIYRSLV